MIKKIKLIFLISILLVSCKTDSDDYLKKEFWLISEITFKGKDLRPDLTNNLIRFKQSNKCVLPIVNASIEDLTNNFDTDGSWYLDKKLSTITIKNKQIYFNQKFNLCFGKDYNLKKIYLILSSDQTYIKAYRGFYSTGFYDKLPDSKNCNQ